MFALEVSINGKKLITAGVEDWSLLHADIMARREKMPEKSFENDEFEINIGGVPIQTEEGKLEHLRWGRTELNIGDTITITLVETENIDPPLKRYRSDSKVQEQPFTDKEMFEMQKQTYLALKEKFKGYDFG